MRRLVIDLDLDKCAACGACAVACMDQNDVDAQCSSDMLRKIGVIEKGSGMDAVITYMSIACMHCNNAPCINACPCACISKDPDTGFIVFDNANCIGCRSCSMACPFSAPTFNDEGKMIKCDGCNTRVKYGLEPACVRVCPFGALSLVEESRALKARESKTLASISRAIYDD